MKKLFLFSVAALALCACSNDEVVSDSNSVVEPKEISFSPLARPNTRAAGTAEYNAVEAEMYPQNYNMKVVAYLVPAGGTPGNYFGSATSDGGILFSYQFAGGASASGTNANYWGGNPAQYWPLSPRYTELLGSI